MATYEAAGSTRTLASTEKLVIFASSLGTVFEWYDFFVYGTLTANISKNFFSAVTNPNAALVFTLLAFAAGFLVRPFGALVFGRLGDLVGRKYTFLVTILIMGISTFLIALVPGYASIGIAAPVILIVLRLFQGLALGGEYGGAATYVAEHAPHGKRGFFTSWIQTTATLGLFLSLIVVISCRSSMSPETFEAWGWRVPFAVSLILLAVSLWIRLKLDESPVFQQMKAEGKGSHAPLTESFLVWSNAKIVILALIGVTAGQAVVWYAGQFYALIFLTQTLKVDPQTAQLLVGGALVIGTPFFLVFGALSDKIGRKPIIMAGCLLAVVTYFPLFEGLTHFANPALEAAQAKAPAKVIADPADCSFQFNPVGTSKFTNSCDVAKAALIARSVPYENVAAPAGSVAKVQLGDKSFEAYPASEAKDKAAAFAKAVGDAVTADGYPAKADPAQINYTMVVVLLFVMMLYVTMVYGPVAAMLVEMFPTRIRYTSMSLPYHIGNGWLGGFLPVTIVAIVAMTGNIYAGLWYPIVIAGVTFVVGMLFVKETKGRSITD
jgi:MFS family permease